MDLQGTPIGKGGSGQKVTTDPQRYTNPVQEKPGSIAADSLAAQSGEFAQKNQDHEPLGVTGGKSTLANTNTSGATTLPSAPDAERREDGSFYNPNASKGPAGVKYPDGLGGQAEYPGRHLPESGYVGGPTTEKQQVVDNSCGVPSSKPTNIEPAPSYVTPVARNLGNTNPKGQNLKEGGFDDNPAHNASFNSEIGTKKDPGRVAENKFQRVVAESGPDAGTGTRHVHGEQPYRALSPQTSA